MKNIFKIILKGKTAKEALSKIDSKHKEFQIMAIAGTVNLDEMIERFTKENTKTLGCTKTEKDTYLFFSSSKI